MSCKLVPSYCSPFSYDAAMNMKGEIAKLVHENMKYQHEIELLQKKLEQQNDKLRKMEESKRQSDHDLHHVKESRGKVFRGLNMQTEIVKVQFKRDFDYLKKQIQMKDDVISLQERKIASLVDENCTLKHGFQTLSSLPSHESSGSDLEEEEEVGLDRKRTAMQHSSSTGALLNGHMHAVRGTSSFSGPLPNYAHSGSSADLNPALFQVISQLDSGKFDN